MITMNSTASALTPSSTHQAIFAGGCFWCIEAELQDLDGVKSVTSGYTGGHVENPTYQQIGTGQTGHAEAVLVEYDPTTISYPRLLEVYWDNIDPTDEDGQFYDRGSQYRTAIFYRTAQQKEQAEASKTKRQSMLLDQPIVTTIEPASTFYPAEAYHQDYYQTNPDRYNAYKKGSRRQETLKKVWGK